MPPLLYAIDALLELKDVAIRNVETRGCLHIDFLLEVGIEVGHLNVHLMKFEVVLSCECKHGVERGKLSYRGKGLVKVDAFDLSETLCN